MSDIVTLLATLPADENPYTALRIFLAAQLSLGVRPWFVIVSYVESAVLALCVRMACMLQMYPLSVAYRSAIVLLIGIYARHRRQTFWLYRKVQLPAGILVWCETRYGLRSFLADPAASARTPSIASRSSPSPIRC
jgi:hypothetical protein